MSRTEAPQPLTVADCGCSQGQSSLRPVGEAVAVLRPRTDPPITVVHTDLPGNDFTASFEAIAHDPSSHTTTDGARTPPHGHPGSEGMMGLMDEALAEMVSAERLSADAAAEATLRCGS